MPRNSQIRTVLLALVALATAWGFSTLFLQHAPSVFSDPKEDMSFGWGVPVFSLYVLYVERDRLLKSLGAPSWGGLLASLPFLAIGFLGVRGIQVRFEMLSFIGLCVTVPWAFFGRDTAKRMLFPAAFLLFCIPLATYLDVVTVHLRLFSTSLAYAILKGVGAEVERVGTTISSLNGSFAIDIAAPCSGLRSIFALLALTAGYAYFNQPTWLRRGALFAFAIPLAVLGNVMRILTICLVGTYASEEFATGFYHDYSGYVVFLVAIALMVAIGEIITRLAGKRKTVPKDSPAPEHAQKPVSLVVPVLATALLVTAMAFQAMTPAPVVCEPPLVELTELPGFISEELEISEAERTVLPNDTRILKRKYTDVAGHWYVVSVVFGGTSKSSIHRPELCLPSQGFLMTNPHSREIDGASWRLISLDFGREYPPMGFAYTFFNQAGYRTSSHLDRIFRDVWDRSVLNRIDRWVMVTINTSRPDEAGLAGFIRLVQGMKGMSK